MIAVTLHYDPGTQPQNIEVNRRRKKTNSIYLDNAELSKLYSSVSNSKGKFYSSIV